MTDRGPDLFPAIVLRGARQVGKTTLQKQTIQFLLTERRVDARRILRVQFDELPPLRGIETPILDILRWYQNRILGRTLNQAAHAGEPAYVFLDEVQNLPDWAPQLKALVDHHTVQVVVTGNSALRIESGRDSSLDFIRKESRDHERILLEHLDRRHEALGSDWAAGKPAKVQMNSPVQTALRP